MFRAVNLLESIPIVIDCFIDNTAMLLELSNMFAFSRKPGDRFANENEYPPVDGRRLRFPSHGTPDRDKIDNQSGLNY